VRASVAQRSSGDTFEAMNDDEDGRSAAEEILKLLLAGWLAA
jgi:hypothetical protein